MPEEEKQEFREVDWPILKKRLDEAPRSIENACEIIWSAVQTIDRRVDEAKEHRRTVISQLLPRMLERMSEDVRGSNPQFRGRPDVRRPLGEWFQRQVAQKPRQMRVDNSEESREKWRIVAKRLITVIAMPPQVPGYEYSLYQVRFADETSNRRRFRFKHFLHAIHDPEKFPDYFNFSPDGAHLVLKGNPNSDFLGPDLLWFGLGPEEEEEEEGYEYLWELRQSSRYGQVVLVIDAHAALEAYFGDRYHENRRNLQEFARSLGTRKYRREHSHAVLVDEEQKWFGGLEPAQVVDLNEMTFTATQQTDEEKFDHPEVVLSLNGALKIPIAKDNVKIDFFLNRGVLCVPCTKVQASGKGNCVLRKKQKNTVIQECLEALQHKMTEAGMGDLRDHGIREVFEEDDFEIFEDRRSSSDEQSEDSSGQDDNARPIEELSRGIHGLELNNVCENPEE